MLTLLHGLPFLCVLASSAPLRLPARIPDGRSDARDAHAAGLQVLSDTCAKANLLNDAERLLLEAEAWASDREALTRRKASLQKQRIALVRSAEREAYREFLTSNGFARELEELEREEQRLVQETLATLLEFARRSLEEGREEIAVGALESAFVLDPESDQLRHVAGRARLERLRASRARDHSLSRMTLGETIQGPQVALADFEGKVVLWRSASL